MDSIRVGYEFIKNAYYLSRSGNLENVEINARFLYNKLQYIMSEKSRLEVETRLQNRDINQQNESLQNRREELNLVNRFNWQYTSLKFRSGFTFAASQTTNRASRMADGGRQVRTDLEGLQSAFNYYNDWQISSRDALRLNFSYTKYEYTSPDTTQKIDEDESALHYQYCLLANH